MLLALDRTCSSWTPPLAGQTPVGVSCHIVSRIVSHVANSLRELDDNDIAISTLLARCGQCR